MSGESSCGREIRFGGGSECAAETGDALVVFGDWAGGPLSSIEDIDMLGTLVTGRLAREGSSRE